ncbi:hypothetical protein ACFXJ8_10735 [Nonomuraea sp. NPDC059194]|uniref:hypothetical protein n=1 Tax=Nonomuraea sp. NPDC059194 TaxID=3346764 RepID=UPI0036CEAC61
MPLSSSGGNVPSQAGRKEFWCRYATIWVSAKSRYGLTITKKEKKDPRDMLATCPKAAR